MHSQNYKIEISGVVQGIGFRPNIYRIAKKYSLKGKVYNSLGGLVIELLSDQITVDSFVNDIKNLDIPCLKIEKVLIKKLDSKFLFRDFIIDTTEKGEGITEFPPDAKICKNCEKDLLGDKNRKNYPFTSCTQCGPRVTILKKLPYDRQNTTMKYFTRCKSCNSLYNDPESRRFNYETDSCWNCSPWIGFIDFKSKGYFRLGDRTSELEMKLKMLGYNCVDTLPCNSKGINQIIKKAQIKLSEGHILAIKGVGGYQLVADARNSNVIQKLRHKKHRKNKPFVVMMPSIKQVLNYCYARSSDIRILNSRESPIVLIKSKVNDIAYNVNMGSRRLGIMLPYSPLHKILIKTPVVVTSANISGSPIIVSEKELDDLVYLSDYVIVHDRKITVGVDDSLVTNLYDNTMMILRYARGFIPKSYEVTNLCEDTLACGSDLKNTFTLIKENKMYLSQYNGDLEDGNIRKRYQENINFFVSLFKVKLKYVVVDLHPEYYSKTLGVKIAKASGAQIYEIQHHFAHALSVMAEYSITNQCLAIILDGTGYGTDGTIWGGELLVVSPHEYKRLAYLEKFKLIGAQRAIREPYRQIACVEEKIDLMCKKTFNCKYLETELGKKNVLYNKHKANLLQIKYRNISTADTSSCGRVFDLAAALILNIEFYSYEGEAAMKLEEEAKAFLDEHAISFFYLSTIIKKINKTVINDISLEVILSNKDIRKWIKEVIIMSRSLCNELNIQSLDVLCYAFLIAEYFKDSQKGAFAFHLMLASAISHKTVSNGKNLGITTCILSGGVFQNEILLILVKSILESYGFKVLFNTKVPCNDEGISLGQAYYAVHNISKV